MGVSMTDNNELLTRLEAATEGSRELDAEIALATFYHEPDSHDDSLYVKLPHKHDECAAGTYWLVSRSGMSLRTAPNYTTSIDAALTLVPEGYFIHGMTIGNEICALWILPKDWRSKSMTPDASVPGNRPALAICIAALKARQGDDHG